MSIFKSFLYCSIASIRIGQKIQCFLYAGFFLVIQQKNAIAYHIFEVKFITQNLIREKFEPHSMCGPMLQNVKLFNGQMVQWFNGSMIKCA